MLLLIINVRQTLFVIGLQQAPTSGVIGNHRRNHVIVSLCLVWITHSLIQSHLDTLVRHILLGFLNAVFTKVENTGSEHRIGFAFDYAVSQML